ncbi:MAG: YncE family protein [Actinobacteria bacterium]|nr:YncE family protein [Actinomycetota bacterium]
MRKRHIAVLTCALILFGAGQAVGSEDSDSPTVIPSATPAEIKLTSDSKLVLVKTITGEITPKSVRSSKFGIVSAHNMMYRHSITIYNSKTFALIKTIPDKVQLSSFGLKGYSGTYQGAPVEGAFSPDEKYLYVTNYAMYGKGFNREGHDTCSPASNFDKSYLYRINLDKYVIDAVYQVGVVPKVVEVTPDNKYVLVTNWCSYDLKVISVATQKVVKTIKIGAYPRGITVSSDAKTAYVAQMGGSSIHRINLTNLSTSTIYIGSNPRALVLSPDNKTLYATLNRSGKVVAFDLVRGRQVASVTTGKAARSLAISTDGSAIFVVNFVSGTVSKVATAGLKVMQTVWACNHPIGVTFDESTNRTWVACYHGQIKVFDNK